jgi:predicted nucleic acid-binding protein
VISSSGFWDSSSLTALFVRERTTVQARVQIKRFAPIVWWATTLEIQSAIARMHRAGDLSGAERQVAVDRLAVVSAGWHEIVPSDEMRRLAADMLSLYPLRAADSLQLAAATVWCQAKPKGRAFVCQDERLGEAAAKVGFDVVQL